MTRKMHDVTEEVYYVTKEEHYVIKEDHYVTQEEQFLFFLLYNFWRGRLIHNFSRISPLVHNYITSP